MFSQAELTIRKTRMELFKRLTKHAQQAVIYSGSVMAMLPVLLISDQNWYMIIAAVLPGLGLCYFSRWVAAVGTAISDNYDLLEDLHRNLDQQKAP